MHTNWCVLIEISMEIGMLNFLSGIIGLCTEGRISLRGEYSVWVPSGPSRLSFFKIWPFSAEFHITYMYDIFIYLAKIMLLRENLFMAEFFNSHQKLCQGTNDKKLIHIHNLYTPKLKRKPKDCFRSVTLGTLT